MISHTKAYRSIGEGQGQDSARVQVRVVHLQVSVVVGSLSSLMIMMAISSERGKNIGGLREYHTVVR